jgi:hypothetical protein
MYSIDYILANTRLVRRLLHWRNKKKLEPYEREESRRYLANSLDLRNFEKKIFSQNGEDGIIEEIFNRIGTTNKYFVEFGVENGKECNTRYLLEKNAWSGLWMDGCSENARLARSFFKNFSLKFLATFITSENIESLFKNEDTPSEMDLLSIDIDGNDYWVWKTLTKYRPRLLIIEYNASFPPPARWVMPYKSDHLFDGTRNFGASLESLVELGKEKGYSLIACDKNGVNAFFLRNDLLSNKFLIESTDYFYSAPKYGYFFGHPKGKGPWIKRLP